MDRHARCFIFLVIATLVASLAVAQVNPAEQKTSRYFDSIRSKPPLLQALLHDMPKGGDLHNHLPGALYAENLIDYAAKDGLCVDRTTSILIAPPCDASCDRFTSKPAIHCAYGDHVLYNSIIDAWSMRNWHGEESGHDHFFATFDKFIMAFNTHVPDALAEAANRAAADHLQYLELMHTADGMAAPQLGNNVGWDNKVDFPRLRQKMLAAGLDEILAATRAKLDNDEAQMRSLLRCATPQAAPGCHVQIRYLYQVLRGLPPEQVFAQILLGFELASADPRFVGLNLVMPEDWYVPMQDFHLHMQMLDYLHSVYPKIHITLHAGELAPGLVPPEGLRSHIRESIERGHAERIGHGVSVMREDDALGLLQEMARKNVLVEICLTSNDLILGVGGDEHPFSAYRQYNVPLALATDDQGVSRSDMTQEWLRAVQSYNLSYADLKQLARQSLEHSFLPGASLWSDTKNFHPVSACAGTAPSATPSSTCQKFLSASERAQVQWKLEEEFRGFESKF